MLVDSGVACHVCPPDWATRMSSWNKQSTSTVEKGSETLAPAAEDVRDLGTTASETVRRQRRLHHELTHLPAATRCEACMKGRGREASHQDKRGSMLDSVLPVIQCDYGSLTDVGEEPVDALFASCRSSTNLFVTLCSTKGPKDT